MTDDEKIQTLSAALRQPETPEFPHAQIRAKLSALKASYDVPGPPSSPAPAAPPQARDDSNDAIPRIKRGLTRMDQVAAGPAVALNQFVDTLSGGLYRKATGELAKHDLPLVGKVQVGPSEAQYQQVEEENPFAMNTAKGLAYMSPEGVPAAIGRGVGKFVDPLTRAISKRIPNIMGTLTGRAAAAGLEGAARGAGTAAATTAYEGVTRDEPAREIIRKAKQNAEFAGAFGAGANIVSQGAGAAARARLESSPDLQKLDRYGLEPGPLPGRPVIRKDEGIMQQLPIVTEAPLGRGRVTPATRGGAARVAGDPIVDDLTAHSRANNARMGEMRGELYGGEPGQRVSPFKHILTDLNKRLAAEEVSDATKVALSRVREKFDQYLPKPPPPPPPPPPPIQPSEHLLQLQQLRAQTPPGARQVKFLDDEIAKEVAKLTPPPPPPPKPPEPPPPFTAASLDKIRQFADDFVSRGEISAKDVQFIQAADLMRNTVRKVAPEITDLNAAYHKTRQGLGARKAMLGMKKAQRGEGEDVYEAVGRRVRETDEETATAGIRTNRDKGGANIERLSEMGQPPILPGAKLPPDFSYRGRLDVPRLQVSQENLQMMPSKMFSGAGRTQLAAAIPDRLLYPALRRLGEKQVGANAMGVDELTRVLRQRGKKKKTSRSGTVIGGERLQ